MAQAPPLAKISAPRIADVIPRPQLAEELDRLCRRSVVWIQSIPGAGKTTMVANYVRNKSKSRLLWLHLDAGDNDAASFFHYLALAMKQSFPDGDIQLPDFTPEYAQDPMVFSRNFFRRYFTIPNKKCFLVLDNYHEVLPDSILHSMLAVGLQETPDNVSVLIISRAAPPDVYAKLTMNRNLVRFDDNLLRFSVDEALHLAQWNAPSMNRESVIALMQRLDGWAAGLVLLMEQAPAVDEIKATRERSRTTLFNYFLTEIFNQLPQLTQELLLKTALLPCVPAVVAEELLSHGQAREILDELVRKNFFTQRLEQKPKLYRYHPLFQEFLLHQFESVFSLHEQSTHRYLAAQQLQLHGMPEDAITLYIRDEHWQEAISLTIQVAETMIEQGRHKTLAIILEQLPESYVDSYPELSYWCGMVQLDFDAAAAQVEFERAWRLFQAWDDQDKMLLAWSGVVDAIIASRNRFSSLDPWLDWFIQHYGLEQPFPSANAKARALASLVAILLYRYPNYPGLHQWLDAALRALPFAGDLAAGDAQLAFRIRTYAMMLYYFRGELQFVEPIDRALAKQVASGTIPTIWQLAWRWIHIAYRSQVAGNEQETLEQISNALQLADTSGVHYWDGQLFGQALFLSDKYVTAEKRLTYLQSLQEITDFNRAYVTSFYYFHAARHALTNDECDQAQVMLGLASTAAAASSSPFLVLLTMGLQVMLSAIQGKLSQAKREQQQLQEYLGDFVCLWADFGLAATHAWLELQSTRSEDVDPALQAWLSLGSRYGFTLPWMTKTSLVTDLAIAALQRDLGTKYIQRLIVQENVQPTPACRLLPNWPWQIKIFTLGAFRIDSGAVGENLASKSSRTALELLKCLIAFGGVRVSREKVSEMLWPDSEGDDAKRTFDTTLYRLRKLLHSDQVVLLKDGLVTLNERLVWVDCWAFEALISRMDAIAQDNTLSEAGIELAQQMLTVYQGDFLQLEGDRPWSIVKKERLRRLCLKALSGLGRQLQKQAAYSHAEQILERGLAVDSAYEPFYQALIQVHLAQGHWSLAKSVYHRCRKVLATTLGVMPSNATVELYRQAERHLPSG